MAPPKATIVRTGTGGIGVVRNRFQVTIYERSTSASEVGYAFRITASSDRCLRNLDIDTVAGAAVAANSSRMFNV